MAEPLSALPPVAEPRPFEVASPPVAEPDVAEPLVPEPPVALPRPLEVASPRVAEPEVAEPLVALPPVASPRPSEEAAPPVAEPEVAEPLVALPPVAEPFSLYVLDCARLRAVPESRKALAADTVSSFLKFMRFLLDWTARFRQGKSECRANLGPLLLFQS
jgi:hypothetical protein